MYLYNITISVTWDIQKEWLSWMQETYLNKLDTFMVCTKKALYRIKDIDETEGPTYALQIYIDNEVLFQTFLGSHLNSLQLLQKQTWGDKMLSFATILEFVH